MGISERHVYDDDKNVYGVVSFTKAQNSLLTNYLIIRRQVFMDYMSSDASAIQAYNFYVKT